MDHLPIYSQHYRKARGLAVNAKAEDKRSDQAIDDVEHRAKPITAASATSGTSKDQAADAGPKREIRELRLGRVTRKHPHETPSPAAPPLATVPVQTTTPTLTTRRGVQARILTSVQRRSIPSRRSEAGSADRPGRRWRLKAATIAALSLAAIVWPTNEPIEEVGVGQGGPVIGPEQEAVAVATTVPDEAPNNAVRRAATPDPGAASIDAAQVTARVSPVVDVQPTEPSAPPPSFEASLAPIRTHSTAMANARAASETALAAILTTVKRQETAAAATASDDDPVVVAQEVQPAKAGAISSPVDLAREAKVKSPEAVTRTFDEGATSGAASEAPARAEAAAPRRDQSSALALSVPKGEAAAPPPEPNSVDAERRPADDLGIIAPDERNGSTDVVAVASPGSQAGFDSRIVVHMSAGDPSDAADAVMRALVDVGYRQPEFRRVDFAISATNVRYFFSDDRSDAELIDRIVAKTLGGDTPASPRDFTHYRPLPIQDTVEVWVAD